MTKRKFNASLLARHVDVKVGDKFLSENGSFRYLVVGMDEVGLSCIDCNQIVDPLVPTDIRYYTMHCLPLPYWHDKDIINGRIVRVKGNQGRLRMIRPKFKLRLWDRKRNENSS